MQLVENAQEEKARTQRFLDEFEQKYTLGVIAATALAIVLPLLLGHPFPPTFYRAMTLLVVASPCALVISTPASILSAIANAARQGILFKGGVHLENMAGVKAIAFDKTGTLTRGKPSVTDIIPTGGHTRGRAAGARGGAGGAVRTSAGRGHRGRSAAPRARLSPGKQLRSHHRPRRALRLDGTPYLIGNRELFNSCNRCEGLSDEVDTLMTELEAAGKTVMVVGVEATGEPVGVIAVADQVRPESRQTIEKLRKLGIEHVVMLTGDNERVAHAIGGQRAWTRIHAGLMPQDKVAVVQALARQLRVGGDGRRRRERRARAGRGDGGYRHGRGRQRCRPGDRGRGAHVGRPDEDTLCQGVEPPRPAVVWQNIVFAMAVIAVLVASNFIVGVPLPLGVVGHEGSTLVVVANGLRLLRPVAV